MFKSTIAAAAAAVAFAPAAALAGPYVNVETNAGWTGDDYIGATTDIHIECAEMDSPSFTGIPAPAYLEPDPWFAPPVYTEKQVDYMEQETEMKRQEREENFSVEPDDIHQKMYEIATKNQSTTLHLDPPGGSETFQQGPGGWNSGTGMGQFKS